jgi:hypothetical protein
MKREPVLILAVVQAVVYLVTEFGVDLTDRQQAAILGVVAAVLTLVARQSVTPTE